MPPAVLAARLDVRPDARRASAVPGCGSWRSVRSPGGRQRGGGRVLCDVGLDLLRPQLLDPGHDEHPEAGAFRLELCDTTGSNTSRVPAGCAR